MTTEANAYETPLLDRLRSVPFDARDMYSHGGPFKTRLIPYGRHCHDAAAEIARLQAQVDALADALKAADAALDSLATNLPGYGDMAEICAGLSRKALREIEPALAAVGR